MPVYIDSILQRLYSRPLLFLSFLFIVVQALLFSRIGVFTGLEAEKYIIQGNLLFDTGHFSDSKYVFYLPVILLVYFCRLATLPLGFIVAIQVILAAVALLCFYRLSLFAGNKQVAFFSSAILAVFIPLQSWNFYLYSDSIFNSLSIIYVYALYRFNGKGWKGLLFVVLALTALVFSRPIGMLFIPPTVVYLIFRSQSRGQFWLSLAAAIAMVIGLYGVMYAVFTGGGDINALKPFIEEHIICFVPMKPQGVPLDIITTSNPVRDLFYYIVHNPAHFFRLMLLKLISFFNMTRSYYSGLHNTFLVIFMVPIYVFTIPGVVAAIKKHRNVTIFLLSLLILYPLAVTFQCDDWHSRFTMPVIPYFILFGCLGIYQLTSKKSKSAA